MALGYIHTYILGGRYRDAVHGFSPQTSGEQYKIQQEPRVLRRDGAQPKKTESYSDMKAALTDCGCAAGGVGGQRKGTTRVCANCTTCVRA